MVELTLIMTMIAGRNKGTYHVANITVYTVYETLYIHTHTIYYAPFINNLNNIIMTKVIRCKKHA